MQNKVLFVFLFLVLVAIVSCKKEQTGITADEKIVATVGDRVITAEEFRRRYEFDFGQIKKGNNPKLIYLNYLIDELLLSSEGFRLGYNNKPYVQKRVTRRRNTNLLEAFYTKYVHKRVKIPENRIQESLKKSTVKFRMIVWPVPTFEKAKQVQLATAKSSLKDYIDEQLAKQEVKISSRKSYETDWMDFMDMPPETFAVIKDLEIGKTSEPFPFNDGYAVAEVLDINLHGITAAQLLSGPKRKNMEDRLYNIISDSLERVLMDSVMTPLNVRVKSNVVDQLAAPLYQWYKDGLPGKRSVFDYVDSPADTAKPYIQQINQLLDQTLVTYEGGEKTVRDYLHYMDYYRRNLNESRSFEDFNLRLVTEIGRQVKDQIFINIAETEGYADSAVVLNDLRIWEQKWTYDVYREDVVTGLDVSEEEMKSRFAENNKFTEEQVQSRYHFDADLYNDVLYDKHMARIKENLSVLREQFPVVIYRDILDQIPVTQSTKANDITLFLRKKFTSEAVYPNIDLKWFHL